MEGTRTGGHDIRSPEAGAPLPLPPELQNVACTRPVGVVVLTTFNLDDRAATAIRHGARG